MMMKVHLVLLRLRRNQRNNYMRKTRKCCNLLLWVLVASNQQKKGPSYTPTKTNKRSVGDEGSSNRRMSPSSGSMNPSEIFESNLEKRTKKKRRETTTSDSSEEGEETPDKINKRATKKRLSFSSTDDEEQAAAVLPGLPGFKILTGREKSS